MSIKTVSIFGVTGSVGSAAADLVLSQHDRFKVRAVTAHGNVALLARQAISLKADCAVIADPALYGSLSAALAGSGVKAMAGRDALLEVAVMPCDLMVAGIAGFAGLEPLIAALEAGINVALANKEPLVAAGAQVLAAAARGGARLLPVDSEHNAVFQVFDPAQRAAVEKIILTASGGPFLRLSITDMAAVTPAQAVAHPNWTMGRKISVDSATLMNKGLEVIEALHLFEMPAEAIEVVIHPQSIVHSMVAYQDGSILAQMGAPDMRTPLAYCLAWPERMPSPGARLSFTDKMKIDFEPVDNIKFPALALCYDALHEGAWACAALNAANEVAVKAFLDRQIGFLDIVTVSRHILDITAPETLNSVADVIAFDEAVRLRARSCVADKNGKEVYAA